MVKGPGRSCPMLIFLSGIANIFYENPTIQHISHLQSISGNHYSIVQHFQFRMSLFQLGQPNWLSTCNLTSKAVNSLT